MVKVLSFVLLAAFCLHQISATSIPDKFFGSFDVEKSENFDEYLSAKGVGWLVRKMIQLAGLTKKFEKGADGTYIVENSSSKGSTKWEGVKLGKQFEGPGLDGTTHKITFNFVNGELTERRIRQHEGKEIDETYFYTINDDGKLVMRMEHEGIVCRRWFKKN